jgi:hypothetical protein
MKASVALVVAILLIFGVTVIVFARFYQVQVIQTVPFNERHDVDLGYATPSTYSIGPGNSVYLTYNLRNGTVVRATMIISGGSGDDINLYIRNSAGNTVFNPGRVSNTYSYSFTAQKDDNYRVYMDNSFSIVSTKTVYYIVIEAYYTDIKYGPRTTYSTLGQQYSWLEWIGVGAVLFPVGMITFLGAQSLENRRRIAAQTRAAEQQLAEEREQQRLRKEEEQRRLTIKQNAENLMKAGRYEEAAKYYEQLEMWNEAGECRRLARTTYVVAADIRVGKDGISVNCPHCGSSERLESKASEVTCRHCGRTYYIPKKILDMI